MKTATGNNIDKIIEAQKGQDMMKWLKIENDKIKLMIKDNRISKEEWYKLLAEDIDYIITPREEKNKRSYIWNSEWDIKPEDLLI